MEQRIVICAPTGQDAALTARVLHSVGIGCSVCKDTRELVQELARGAGAVLLVEEALTGSGMSALATYIAAQPTWSDIPVLLLTHSGADSLEVQRAVENLGNVSLLERPVRTIALITAARSAVRARVRQYQVRDADQRKDEFLATLAHELRNPLAPIRTSMAILGHLHPASDAVLNLRHVVDRQVTHLTRLVDDLLDVARITSGKVVLKRAPVELKAIVNHAAEISSSIMQEKQHVLAIEQPEQDHVLHADQARLVQTVANLLVNAAKFTPEPGEILLKVAVSGDTVQFLVKDPGVGMERSSLSRIFDLFVQTPVAGQSSSGLGIGLSLARQFSQMHGGTISATSPGLGLGSEFILSLPVVMKNNPTPPADTSAKASALSATPTSQTRNPMPTSSDSQRKILVVDDNIDAANTLEALLSMDGFAVRIAYDGASAVKQVQADVPDAIIMDIGMPGMDGYDAARLIRQQPGADKVILVALTGWGQTTDKKRASEAGFDHHLVKPVDYDILLNCLALHLGKAGKDVGVATTS
ncbi:MAG: response regulator [Pseudomonadota bacterium]